MKEIFFAWSLTTSSHLLIRSFSCLVLEYFTLVRLIITRNVFAALLYIKASRVIELRTKQQTKASRESIISILIKAFISCSKFVYLLNRYMDVWSMRKWVQREITNIPCTVCLRYEPYPSSIFLVPVFQKEISSTTMTFDTIPSWYFYHAVDCLWDQRWCR